MQIRLDQGIDIKMPETEHEYLVSWLGELGYVSSSMGGITPIDNREIESWINLNGVEITHWEVRMIRKLSSVYCSQYNKSKDLDCAEPFETEIDLTGVRNKAEQKIRNAF